MTLQAPSQWGSAPRKLTLKFIPFINTFFLCSLFLHAVYVSNNIREMRKSLENPITPTVHVPLPSSKHQPSAELPNLFIYRRTKKTGSTAMVDALLQVLEPHGYVPVYVVGEEASAVVRSEAVRLNPRRLFVAKHNQVTKDFEPRGRAVIADTFRDGYQQITSYCRYFKRVSKCDKELAECLTSRHALSEATYRWAYRAQEDADTYVDLPLSAAHPALSTTVLRTLFPNATIQLDSYNVANSTCPEIPALRKVYNENYRVLELQIEKLRKRMLIMAGYPMEVDPKIEGSISFAEMLDAAENIERNKYAIRESSISTARNPKSHNHLSEGLRAWTRDGDSVTVKARFENL